LEELEKFIGKVETSFSADKLAFPGMKYKHYSLKAEVILSNKNSIHDLVYKLKKQKKKVAVLLFNLLELNSDYIVCFEESYEKMAKEIFSYFRYLDNNNFDVIVVEEVEEKGLGRVIMNRLKKAVSSV